MASQGQTSAVTAIQAELESSIQALEFLRGEEKGGIGNFSVLTSPTHPHVQLARLRKEGLCIALLEECVVKLKVEKKNDEAKALIKYFLERYPHYGHSLKLLSCFYRPEMDADYMELEPVFVDYYRTAAENAVDRLDEICFFNKSLLEEYSRFKKTFPANHDESPHIYQQLRESGWLNETTDKVFVAHERVYQAMSKFFVIARNLFQMVDEFLMAIQQKKFEGLSDILNRYLPKFDHATQLKLKEKIKFVLKPFGSTIPDKVMGILAEQRMLVDMSVAQQPIVLADPQKESKAGSKIPTLSELNKQCDALVALRAREVSLRKENPTNPEIEPIARQRSDLEKNYVSSFVGVLRIFLNVPGGHFAVEKLITDFLQKYPYYGHGILVLSTFFGFKKYQKCDEYLAGYFLKAQTDYDANRNNWFDIQAQYNFFLAMWPEIVSDKNKMARNVHATPQDLRSLNSIFQQVTEFAMFTGLVLLEHATPIAQVIAGQAHHPDEMKGNMSTSDAEQKGWSLILIGLKMLEREDIKNTELLAQTLERVKSHLQITHVDSTEINTMIEMVEKKCLDWLKKQFPQLITLFPEYDLTSLEPQDDVDLSLTHALVTDLNPRAVADETTRKQQPIPNSGGDQKDIASDSSTPPVEQAADSKAQPRDLHLTPGAKTGVTSRGMLTIGGADSDDEEQASRAVAARQPSVNPNPSNLAPTTSTELLTGARAVLSTVASGQVPTSLDPKVGNGEVLGTGVVVSSTSPVSVTKVMQPAPVL